MATSENEGQSIQIGIPHFPLQKGSLRFFAGKINLSRYQALTQTDLLNTHYLPPEERIAAKGELQDLAIMGYALDTVSTFASLTVWEKFLVAGCTYKILHANTKTVGKNLSLSLSTEMSVGFLDKDDSSYQLSQQLQEYIHLGQALLLKGRGISQLEAYQWVKNTLSFVDNDVKSWATLIGEFPKQFYTEREKSLQGKAQKLAIERRLRWMAESLVEAGLLPAEKTDSRNLRRRTLQKHLQPLIDQHRLSGEGVRVDEFAAATGLSGRRTQDLIAPLRRNRNEFLTGMDVQTHELIQKINAILDARVVVEKNDSPEEIALKRAKVDRQLILDELAAGPQGEYVSPAQLKAIIQDHRDLLNMARLRTQFTPDLERQIQELAARGMDYKEIAKELTLDPGSVWKRVGAKKHK